MKQDLLFSTKEIVNKEVETKEYLPDNKNSQEKNKMRTLDELINRDESAWQYLSTDIAAAKNKVEVLPVDKQKSESCLLATQVTTRSAMGAIIYHTGGILIEDGWLRILGSGGELLTRSIASWNKGKSYNESMQECKFLLIADDAAGGFFSINAGAFGNNMGSIYYLSPDLLEWEDLEISYSDFIYFAFNGKVTQFYENMRWKGWQEDIKNLSPDEAYSFYPFLWTREGKDINQCSKQALPISEIYSFNTESLKSKLRDIE